MPAPRTLARIGSIIAIALFAVVAAHAVANLGVHLLPKEIEFQSSWMYWAAVAAIGIPVFLAVETYGRMVFSQTYLQKVSSPVRIAIVVFFISLACAALIVLRQFILDSF